MKHNQETLDYDVFPELVNDISDISSVPLDLQRFSRQRVRGSLCLQLRCVWHSQAFAELRRLASEGGECDCGGIEDHALGLTAAVGFFRLAS